MDLLARLARVREYSWRILQCGVAASAAFAVCRHVLHHPQPIFGPVAAVVALGVSYGQRLRRVVEVVVGVALGVLVGDLLTSVAGSGVWQIALVVMLGMSVAIFLRAGSLMINQAAIQGVFVTTLLPPRSAGIARWEDAVTGGLVALVLAVFAPASPLRRPLELSSRLVAEIADLLIDATAAARAGDGDRARTALEHARGTQRGLDTLQSAASEGLELVSVSPLRRRSAPGLRQVVALAVPLDRAVRNVRVLVRRLAVATERHEEVPSELFDLLDALASAALRLGEDVAAGRDRRPAIDALAAVGAASLAVPRSTLSADVVLAQARSTVVDLLEVAGVDEPRARALVPVGDLDDPPRRDHGIPPPTEVAGSHDHGG